MTLLACAQRGVFILSLALLIGLAAAQPASAPTTAAANIPQVIGADELLQVSFGLEQRVLPRGLQPSMLCTRSGALIVQAQVPDKPFPSKRISYFSAMSTVISRDGGQTWTVIPLKPGENGMNMEGGAIQLRDGTIIALDTYITPGAKADQGLGQRYSSQDDWHTLEGPSDVTFDLPGIEFFGSSDDGGRPHAAQRLHRRIIEMPNGDLLTTFYGWKKGDNTPSTYQPRMMKTRVMLARSADRGKSWKLISTIGADPSVGTEGFDEPVICRVSKGDRAGRLFCLMRTGRALYESVSDDEGLTWTPPAPRIFADRDVLRTELWIDQFQNRTDFKGKPLDENNLDELRGAVVDPDLIELRSGLLVAAFGVRVPQKLCWRYPEHPWNGNYLAFSRDQGRTWSHIVQITSGVLTTHYMAIEETPTDNQLYITYDLGGWSKGMPRDVYGRLVTVSAAGQIATLPSSRPAIRVVDGVVQPRRPVTDAIADAMRFLKKADGAYVPGKIDGELAGYFTSAFVNEDGSRAPRQLAFPARQHAYFIFTFLGYSKYSNEPEWLARARDLADWNLAHSTPAGAAYPNLPYSAWSDGKGGGSGDKNSTEPDKAAFFGSACVALFEVSGDKKYLDAARTIAATLLRHQNDDGSWPFRVIPEDGKVLQEFGGAPVFFVQFFQDLLRHDERPDYRQAQTRALKLMLERNVERDQWGTYHEDVGPKPPTHLSAEPMSFTASYLFRNAQQHPEYLQLGRKVLASIEQNLVNTEGHPAAPAPAVSEQSTFQHIMPGHTARYCLALVNLYQASGDENAKKKAMSGINALTWMQSDAGLFRTFFQLVNERNPGKVRPNWYSQHLYTVCHVLQALPALPEMEHPAR